MSERIFSLDRNPTSFLYVKSYLYLCLDFVQYSDHQHHWSESTLRLTSAREWQQGPVLVLAVDCPSLSRLLRLISNSLRRNEWHCLPAKVIEVGFYVKKLFGSLSLYAEPAFTDMLISSFCVTTKLCMLAENFAAISGLMFAGSTIGPGCGAPAGLLGFTNPF